MEAGELDHGNMGAGGREGADQENVDDDTCLRCGAPLVAMGVDAFRVGGTTGGWKLLFGEWAELGEGMLPLEVRACSACRTVDLRVPGPEAGPHRIGLDTQLR
jgi:hypothetical protein